MTTPFRVVIGPNPRQYHWTGNTSILARRERLMATQPRHYFDFFMLSDEDQIVLWDANILEEPDGIVESALLGCVSPRCRIPCCAFFGDDSGALPPGCVVCAGPKRGVVLTGLPDQILCLSEIVHFFSGRLDRSVGVVQLPPLSTLTQVEIRTMFPVASQPSFIPFVQPQCCPP